MSGTQIVFMIQNKEGFFSTGGSSPRFTAKGKAWTNIGHLKNHLNMFIDYMGRVPHYPYNGCKLVTLERVIKDTTGPEFSLDSMFTTLVKHVKDERQAIELRDQQRKAEAESKKLAELKAKYEGK